PRPPPPPARPPPRPPAPPPAVPAAPAANYSNLLLIAAGTALLGLIVFFVFKKKIYEGNHALETEESAK
ncbi:LPXTG cell wall anchor domain-containing protein, partial [Bifidobacterium adolescentis]|uniref:LPXTG cell wall anchor domain-containing protein n=1 Tax=Bifidobacterium adolescentis TaxID=1680 RepID=UPI00398D50BD